MPSLGRSVRRRDERPTRSARTRPDLSCAAGQAGTGQWLRGALGSALWCLGRGGRRGWEGAVVGAEDLGLGLAFEQLDELLALDGLAPQQDVGGRVELLAMLLEGKNEDDVFGRDERALPAPPPAPEAPERKPERAPAPLPRPGLAGGTAEIRGESVPERPEPA